ncbi:MAG TPA: helix-turn-helix domain-containing protein [Methylomirabilota bacterium]|nr:helix-turn-helix domain-containing protein [Methylomirabilota bacterium]
MQEDKLLDVQSVADHLDVNPRTVLRMVERGELPAIKVAHRLRFRRSDLENYLLNHLSISSPSHNGNSNKHAFAEIGELLQDERQDNQEDELEIPAQVGDTEPESAPKEHTHLLGAQNARRSNQATQLKLERQRLEIEEKKLELQRQLLELEARRIDHALEAANKLFSLFPEIDAKTKVTMLQSLLPTLMLPEQSKGLEVALKGLSSD